jgi:uncharacterized damage-inducible protein DinB
MILSSTNTKSNYNSLKVYFTELAEYINWADHLAMSWLTQISDEQWNQVSISSFGSIRETAVHIVSAKKIWMDMWTDVSDPVYLSSNFKGTKDELINIWKNVSADLKHFINFFPEESYVKDVTVKKPNGELIKMEFRRTFPHMVNHSTYHRGQLVTLLRQGGFSDFSNTDLFTYYNNIPGI